MWNQPCYKSCYQKLALAQEHVASFQAQYQSLLCGGSLFPHHPGIGFSTRKLLKSLVVTEEECHLQWDGRQEQNIPVLYVITQPTFNQLHYMVCDMALQHQVRYGKWERKGWK